VPFGSWADWQRRQDLRPEPGPSITAVIATLNEAPSVAEVIRGTLEHVPDVLVIDGGSDDGTCEVAGECGARVVEFPERGKGRALQHTIATEDADILLFIDADGSHDPADIPRLLEPILAGEADLVIGSRITGGSDELDDDRGHLIRALGSNIIQKAINLRFGSDLTDVQNGYRAIRTSVARDLELREPRFCIEQEMAMQCLRRGYRVVNVPAHEYERTHGRSRIRVWAEWPKYVWNAISLTLRPSVRGERRAGDGNGPPGSATGGAGRAFGAIVALFLLLAFLYSAIIPLGFGPDEPRHYLFVKLMTEQHKLSRVMPDGRELGGAIGIHPPGYYLFLSIFYFPAQWLGGVWWTQRLFRFFSPFFGVATLGLVWGACRRVFPDRPWLALFIPAVQALWPHFLLDHSVINNDNGANLMGAAVVYFLVCRPEGQWPARSALIGGLLLGLGALMKGQLLLCLPPVLLTMMAWDHGRRFFADPRFWRNVLLVVAVLVVLAAPWYGRNVVLYGQINYVAPGYEGLPPGMSLLDAWGAGLLQSLVLRTVVGIFHSIWVQVGWFPESIAEVLYTGLGMLLALAGIGWLRVAVRYRAGKLARERGAVRGFAALVLPFILIYLLIHYVAAVVHMGVYQGGRYAMFAIPGFVTLLAVGWTSAAPRRLRLIGAVAVLAFFLLLNVVSMWNLITFSNPTYAPGFDFWTPIAGT